MSDNERYFKQCYEDVNKELRAMESAHAREMDALMENRAQRNFYRGVARVATIVWLIGNAAGAWALYAEPERFRYQTPITLASWVLLFLFIGRQSNDTH